MNEWTLPAAAYFGCLIGSFFGMLVAFRQNRQADLQKSAVSDGKADWLIRNGKIVGVKEKP